MVLLYAVSLAISAALLFAVQPMVGKMVLPLLGGTPAVWNTCMVFFQASLLAGYFYAHLVSDRLSRRVQVGLHLAFLCAALLTLPIAISADGGGACGADPFFWLLGRLAVTVGFAFVALAASAPLLQSWFAGSGHRASDDPYFLYAASNAGSLVALLSYPLVIEVIWPLGAQARGWMVGYGALTVLIAVCGLRFLMSGRRAGAASPVDDSRSARDGRAREGAKPGWGRRLWWLACAAVPSSLMLGVTLHITTNLAAVPLLWVVPLSLYLLSFVLVFARGQVLSPALMDRVLPFVALVLAPTFFVTVPGLEWRLLVAHLVLFFVAAMVCHGRLAADRPAAGYLTSYYLWLATGGVIGGLLNALVAPALFPTVIEYPLMICAACLLRFGSGGEARDRRERWLDGLLPAGLLAVLLAVVGIWFYWGEGGWAGVGTVFVLGVAAGVWFRKRAVRFGLGYAAVLAALGLYAQREAGDLLRVQRNFFGVKRVVSARQGAFHVFYHGTTVHGIERVDAGDDPEPLAYYHRAGPVGDVIRAWRRLPGERRVCAMGLGAGTLAAYMRAGERIDFYEIDPAVARIARDPRYFSYLEHCKGTFRILLGDARLEMARRPNARYGLILMDAYSSDAVPTHLLTREALALYLRRLDAHGLIAFHVTNRFMDMAPLLANLARDAGLVCVGRFERVEGLSPEARAAGCAPADVVAMARSAADARLLLEDPRWRRLEGRPTQPIWTDQYSDIVRPLWEGVVRDEGGY